MNDVESPVEPSAPLPDNLRLIGGEMEFWEDRGSDRCPVLVELTTTVVRPGADVLVAGMHSEDVLECTLERAGQVTLLVRGQRDADLAARRWPALHVLSGDVDRLRTALEPGRAFDVVLAFAGLERLNSADAELRPWRRNLQQLQEVLADDGALALGLSNPVGIESLTRPSSREVDDSDAAWSPAQGYDATRPRTAASLRAALGGSADAACYATYPDALRPSMLVADAEPFSSRTVLGSLVLKHAARLRGPRVTDPRALTDRALAGELGIALAPGWLAVSGAAALDPPPAAFVELSGARTRQLGAAEGRTGGELLERRLLTLCLAQDLPAIRRLVREFGAWAARLDAGSVNLRFDNVLLHDDQMSVLDPEDHHLVDDVLLDSLYAFGRRLSALGWRNPFPVAAGPEEIATILAASVEREVDASQIAALGDEPETADPVTSTTDETVRLQAANAALQSKVEWFERTLHQRDRQMALERDRAVRPEASTWRAARKREAKLQARLSAIESSRSYRISRQIGRLGAVRDPRRVVRAVRRRLRARRG